MEIIGELEQSPRGVYTGSLGYLDQRGHLDLNILIRTLELRDDQVRFRTGAGIVADSIPAAELEETRAKAKGLIQGLAAACMAKNADNRLA
jgi:anthranilate synthase component 1